MIDDVAILDQPANDVVLNNAWLSTTQGYQYGRTAFAHQKDSLVLGGEVFNFGINDQMNVEIAMDVKDASGTTVLYESETIATLENDSTNFTQVIISNVSLGEGVYEFSTVATSDADDANGANFNNNSYTRNFEITENLFSIDGIGVYDDEISSMGYMGTNWGNGTIVMARYELLSETTVKGLEIALTSFSDAGGQIFPFLVTEEVIGEDDMSSNNRLAENEDGVMITQDHIDNNLMYAALEETTLPAGVYYACVELYNGPNEDDGVYILDDETVAQPGSASMFHYVEDGVNYTNGKAAAIRLVLGVVESAGGCTEVWADNYSSNALIDDGSCILTACPYPTYLEYDINYTIANASMCQTWIVEGCTNNNATNFNSAANVEDGSCVIVGCMDSIADNYDEEATIEGDDSCAIYGCLNPTAQNYNEDATIDNGTCIIYGCTLSPFSNYNEEATIDDGSCSLLGVNIYGCTDEIALNFNSQANVNNGSCEYLENNENCNEGISITLLNGWNLVGFSCSTSIDAEVALLPILDYLIIAKDNNGLTYLPEWNYNGIGDLVGGYGYQLKTTIQIDNFNFCEE